MEIVRYWRLNSQRYDLKGTICTNCGRLSLSQRPVCDVCSGSAAGDSSHKEVVYHQAPSAELAAK